MYHVAAAIRAHCNLEFPFCILKFCYCWRQQRISVTFLQLRFHAEVWKIYVKRDELSLHVLMAVLKKQHFGLIALLANTFICCYHFCISYNNIFFTYQNFCDNAIVVNYVIKISLHIAFIKNKQQSKTWSLKQRQLAIMSLRWISSV